MGLPAWYQKIPLASKILYGMVVGIVVGLIFGERALGLQPLGTLFINLLMMCAIPLVFFNLLAGIAAVPDVRSVGRIGGKIMLYYIATTAFAIFIAYLLMSLIQPGAGMELTAEVAQEIGEVPNVVDILLKLVPRNAFAAFSTGNVDQIVVFAVFVGLVTLLLPMEQKEFLEKAYTIIASLLRKLVGVVMGYGPIGIGALAAVTVGQYGTSIFGPLARFIGGVWLAEAIMFVIYMLLLVLLARISPLYFLRKSGPLYATTMATCSSLASLAVSLDIAENSLKLPRNVYAFTLPLGAQLNKDGTGIMLTGVLLFTAQAAGIELGIGQLLSIILIGLILSTGSGGIPGGGLVVAMIFVKAFSLPLEVAAIVAGIYRLIDMANTTMNCMGDLVGTVIVTRLEREYAPWEPPQ